MRGEGFEQQDLLALALVGGVRTRCRQRRRGQDGRGGYEPLQFRDVGDESHGANSGNAGDDGGTLDRGKKGDNAGHGMTPSKLRGRRKGPANTPWPSPRSFAITPRLAS